MAESISFNRSNYTPFHHEASIFAPKRVYLAFPKKLIIPALALLIVGILSYVALRMAVEKQMLAYNQQNIVPTPKTAAAVSVTPTPTEEPTPIVSGASRKRIVVPPTSFTVSTTRPPNPTNPPNTPIPPTSTPNPTATPTPLPPDNTPPVITSMGGPENGSTVNSTSFCFPMTITDDRSHTPNIWTQYQFDNASWTDWSNDQSTAYSPCFSNVKEGEHIFVVHAKDEAGNVSDSLSRDFKVAIISTH